MIKLKTLIFEYKSVYQWKPVLPALRNPNAINAYTIKYKERGKDANVTDDEVIANIGQYQVAKSYQNSKHKFVLTSAKDKNLKKTYVLQIFAANNVPAALGLNNMEPTTILNGAPLYFLKNSGKVKNDTYTAVTARHNQDLDAVVTQNGPGESDVELKQGMEGEAVRSLQKRLGLTGEDSLNGKFGAETFSWLLVWQQENGLAETGVYDAATIAAMKTNNKPVQNVNKAINLTKQARLAAAKRTGTSGTANAVTGGPATNSNSTGAPVVPQEKPVILSIESLNDQLIQKFPKHFTKAFTNGYRVTFGSPATDKNIYVALKRLLMTPAVNVDEDELLSVFRQLSKNQLATFFKEYKNVNNSELYFDLEDTTFNSGEMTSLRDIARSKGLSFAAEDYSIVYKSSDGNYYVF